MQPELFYERPDATVRDQGKTPFFGLLFLRDFFEVMPCRGEIERTPQPQQNKPPPTLLIFFRDERALSKYNLLEAARCGVPHVASVAVFSVFFRLDVELIEQMPHWVTAWECRKIQPFAKRCGTSASLSRSCKLKRNSSSVLYFKGPSIPAVSPLPVLNNQAVEQI